MGVQAKVPSSAAIEASGGGGGGGSDTHMKMAVKSPAADDADKMQQLYNYAAKGLFCDVNFIMKDGVTTGCHSVFLRQISAFWERIMNEHEFVYQGEPLTVFMPEHEIDDLRKVLATLYVGNTPIENEGTNFQRIRDAIRDLQLPDLSISDSAAANAPQATKNPSTDSSTKQYDGPLLTDEQIAQLESIKAKLQDVTITPTQVTKPRERKSTAIMEKSSRIIQESDMSGANGDLECQVVDDGYQSLGKLDERSQLQRSPVARTQVDTAEYYVSPEHMRQYNIRRNSGNNSGDLFDDDDGVEPPPRNTKLASRVSAANNNVVVSGGNVSVNQIIVESGGGANFRRSQQRDEIQVLDGVEMGGGRGMNDLLGRERPLTSTPNVHISGSRGGLDDSSSLFGMGSGFQRGGQPQDAGDTVIVDLEPQPPQPRLTPRPEQNAFRVAAADRRRGAENGGVAAGNGAAAGAVVAANQAKKPRRKPAAGAGAQRATGQQGFSTEDGEILVDQMPASAPIRGQKRERSSVQAAAQRPAALMQQQQQQRAGIKQTSDMEDGEIRRDGGAVASYQQQPMRKRSALDNEDHDSLDYKVKQAVLRFRAKEMNLLLKFVGLPTTGKVPERRKAALQLLEMNKSEQIYETIISIYKESNLDDLAVSERNYEQLNFD